MFHRKPQLGLMSVLALYVHLVADLTPCVFLLEALEGLKSHAWSTQLTGRDGNLAGMHPQAIGRTERGFGIMETGEQ